MAKITDAQEHAPAQGGGPRRPRSRALSLAVGGLCIGTVAAFGGVGIALGGTAPAGKPPAPRSVVTFHPEGTFGATAEITPSLKATKLKSGTRVRTRLGVNSSGQGIVCGGLACPEASRGVSDNYILKTGLRVFGVLQKARQCAPTPPALGPNVVSVTRSAPYRGLERSIDLPPGTFSIQTTFAPGALAKGVWTLCAWYQVDPTIQVSNPTYPQEPDPSLLGPAVGGPFAALGPVKRVRVS